MFDKKKRNVGFIVYRQMKSCVLVDVIILAKLAGYIFFPYPSIDLLFNAGGMSYSPSKIKNNRKKGFFSHFVFFLMSMLIHGVIVF